MRKFKEWKNETTQWIKEHKALLITDAVIILGGLATIAAVSSATNKKTYTIKNSDGTESEVQYATFDIDDLPAYLDATEDEIGRELSEEEKNNLTMDVLGISYHDAMEALDNEQ